MKNIGYYLRRIALGVSILGMFIGLGHAYWITGDDCQGGQGCYIRTLNSHFYESKSVIVKALLVIPAWIFKVYDEDHNFGEFNSFAGFIALALLITAWILILLIRKEEVTFGKRNRLLLNIFAVYIGYWIVITVFAFIQFFHGVSMVSGYTIW